MRKYKRLLCAAAAAAALCSGAEAHAASVLIVQGGWYTSDLKNQLIAAGNTVTEAANYTAASLAGYDAVVQYGNNFVDQTALTSFVTAGGTLVWTPWARLNFAIDPNLQIWANGGNAIYSQSSPGMTVLDAGSDLLDGVSFPAAGATNIGRIDNVGFAAGTTQVAVWADGDALLGHRGLGAGNVVGVNMHVITSDTAYQVINEPWAATLLDNAVNFGGATPAVPEPSTWAMLLLGFFAMGGAMRSARRQRVTVSYA